MNALPLRSRSIGEMHSFCHPYQPAGGEARLQRFFDREVTLGALPQALAEAAPLVHSGEVSKSHFPGFLVS